MSNKTPEAVHVTAEPGLAADHAADAGCWCRPEQLYAISEGPGRVLLHRGARSRVVRLVVRKESR